MLASWGPKIEMQALHFSLNLRTDAGPQHTQVEQQLAQAHCDAALCDAALCNAALCDAALCVPLMRVDLLDLSTVVAKCMSVERSPLAAWPTRCLAAVAAHCGLAFLSSVALRSAAQADGAGRQCPGVPRVLGAPPHAPAGLGKTVLRFAQFLNASVIAGKEPVR